MTVQSFRPPVRTLMGPGTSDVHPRVLEACPLEPFSTNVLWDKALEAGRVFGTPMDAFWMHVGDPKARDAAQNRLSSDHNDANRSV